MPMTVTVPMSMMMIMIVSAIVVVPAAIMVVVVTMIGRPLPEVESRAVVVIVRDAAAVIEKPARAAIPVGLGGRRGTGRHAESGEQWNSKEE
jgi:hypothetical protein